MNANNLNASSVLWNANGFSKSENNREVLTENGNGSLSDETVNSKSDHLPQNINNDESKQSVNYHNGNIIDFKLCNELLTSFEEFTHCELLKNEPVKVNRRKSKTLSVDETLNNFTKYNEVTKLPQQKEYEVGKSVIEHSAQFSISNSDRKRGLSNIIQELKIQHFKKDRDSNREEAFHSFGDTPSTEALENNSQATLKSSRKRRLDRIPPTHNRNGVTSSPSLPADYHHLNNNNNNHVKNERLSPGTPDTSSRSVTPSSASHPDTPPSEQSILTPSGRNYSDFMRSLAAKYNNANPNDYFNAVRNGFTPHLDSRFKPSPFPTVVPSLVTPSNSREESNKKSDFSSVINPFTSPTLFSPFIDMSSTQTLLAMVKTAKEAELQGLLKSTKRHDASSPLDLSAAAPPPIKKPRLKLPNLVNNNITVKRDESQSPKLNEDISNWNVDDVCNFVAGIDICAEYAKNFREQQIDGSGLPLLTEEHLTTKMNMKLGPALKLRSLLARKLGSCTICLHCTHCHRNSSVSPDLGNVTGNTSDSGGTS